VLIAAPGVGEIRRRVKDPGDAGIRRCRRRKEEIYGPCRARALQSASQRVAVVQSRQEGLRSAKRSTSPSLPVNLRPA